MAISTVNLASNYGGYPSRQERAGISSNDRNPNTPNTGSTNNNPSSNQVTTTEGSQVSTSNAAAFTAPNQANQNNRLASDRRNPADIEALSNQFRLQREETQGNKAVQRFQSVAEYEQRDSLQSSTGIDIFV